MEVSAGLPAHLRGFVEKTDQLFNLDGFVQEFMRKPETVMDPQGSLRRLCSELKGAKVSLRDKLIDLLNSNYKDFVGLPAQLTGTREAVERRSILSRRHETLLLLQLAVKAHDHIRRLLDVANAPFVAGDGLPGPASEMVPGNQYPTGAAAKGNKKQLSSSSNLLIMRYRQAVGYNKRRSCGKHKPGKRQEVAIPQLKENLEAALRTTFRESVLRFYAPETKQCLRAFEFADRSALAEEILRESVVKPLVMAAITTENVTRVRDICEGSIQASNFPTPKKISLEERILQLKSEAAEAKSLPTLLSVTLRAIAEQCEAPIRESSFPLTGFNFPTRSIAAEILPALEEQGGSEFFAPYVPDSFAKRYKTSQQLLEQMQNFCLDNPRIDEFRGSKIVDRFEGKWSLAVYFQLRYQQLRKPLEDAVKNPPAPCVSKVDAGKDSPFLLSSTCAVWEGMSQCWHPEIWLERLTHRFFKATVQLLRRYMTWMKEGLGPPSGELSCSYKGTNSSNELKSRRQFKWSPAPEPMSLLKLERDVGLLIMYLSKELIPLMIQRITNHGAAKEEVQELVQTGMKGVTEELKAAQERCRTYIATRVARACVAPMSGVPRIKVRYSMTGIAPPQEPSSYVKGILDPLQKHIKSYKELTCAQDTKSQEWLTSTVSSRIIDRYVSASRELLHVVKKTEAILTRLKKKKVGSKSTGELSDADKIRLQLHLDIRRFKETLAEVGGQPKALRELEDLVRLPGEGLHVKSKS